jgi:CheY-like chemotaxis protein
MSRILLISTDAVLSDVLSKQFSLLGYEILSSSEPENLFKVISGFQPDLLIIDFILNEENGGALCHQVTSNPDTQLLPVVLLSDMSEVDRFSNKFGSDAVISKSSTPDELTGQILEIFEEISNSAEGE